MKVKSVEKIGVQDVYSVEMKSGQHNYILEPVSGHPVHKNSHAVAYSIISFRCLYLKAHYGPEWWASVLSECHSNKRPKYIGVARSEDINFARIDARKLQTDYSVSGDEITLGITSIKGIGNKQAVSYCDVGEFDSVSDFVDKAGKNKTIMERLIKLGAFDHIHNNRRGVWLWYLYKYGSNPMSVGDDWADSISDATVKDLREFITGKFMLPDGEIGAERKRQADEYRKMYPRRRKIPKKIESWMPKIGFKFNSPSFNEVVDLFSPYRYSELLALEKEYLGFYWSNPMDNYVTNGHDIEDAKESGVLECVIEGIELRYTKKRNRFWSIHVTDGVRKSKVNIWEDIIDSLDDKLLSEGIGIKLAVEYNEKYSSFTLSGQVMPLEKRHED